MTKWHVRSVSAIGAILLTAISMSALADGQSPMAFANHTEYADMCDASAAVAIDNERFIVANDEDNVLRVYEIGRSAPRATLSLPFSTTEEIDIEGAARLDDLVFWIGSHGANKNAKPRPTRRQLFATRLTPQEGTPQVRLEGHPYTLLLETLIIPVLEKHGIKGAHALAPEAEGALNIEGLAASKGGLLIGFRNPLIDGKAMIVELRNPLDLIGGVSAAPVLGEVSLLDLGGRGIRSIELISPESGYFIVAGPFGDGDAFAMYTWTGGAAPPFPMEGVAFVDGFRPEALFAQPSGAIYVLSDDGDRRLDGKTICKEMERPLRRFRLGRLVARVPHRYLLP